MKKVLFIASNHKITTGSFRIWVKDYNSYFEKLGIPSKITNKPRDSEIKDCDIIIKMGDKPVSDIYEYMHRLSEYNKGDKVEVVVVRDNMEVSLEVTF